MKLNFWRILGIIGTVLCIGIFIREPSFPTPDKIFIFLLFVFMVYGQAIELAKRFGPFAALLLIYDSFRGIASSLNTRVNYLWMPHMDKLIFRRLPTKALQNLLWKGHVNWYDLVLYGPYTLHFVLPFLLALFVWKKRAAEYWRYVATFVTVSFAGFLTFLAFPAAPPWMASEKGYIEPIVRVSSAAWYHLGIKDFPSVYNKITPNPVAAVPSLHAAYATLLVIFTYKLFGKKWAILPGIYALLIYVGTVYTGEHYAIDEIIGALYGLAAYFGILWVWPRLPAIKKSVLSRIKPDERQAAKS